MKTTLLCTFGVFLFPCLAAGGISEAAGVTQQEAQVRYVFIDETGRRWPVQPPRNMDALRSSSTVRAVDRSQRVAGAQSRYDLKRRDHVAAVPNTRSVTFANFRDVNQEMTPESSQTVSVSSGVETTQRSKTPEYRWRTLDSRAAQRIVY